MGRTNHDLIHNIICEHTESTMAGICEEIGWKKNDKPSTKQKAKDNQGHAKKKMNKWSAIRLVYHKIKAIGKRIRQ